MGVTNKDGTAVAGIGANENDNGEIRFFNKYSKVIGSLPQNHKKIKMIFRYIAIDDDENKEVINNFSILIGYLEILRGGI